MESSDSVRSVRHSLPFLTLRRRLVDAILHPQPSSDRRRRSSAGSASAALPAQPTTREDVLRCARSLLAQRELRAELESSYLSLRAALGSDREFVEDQLGHVDAARSQWIRSIAEELLLLAAEQRQHAASASASDGAGATQAPPLRFLFDSEDLFDAVSSISVPNLGFRREQQWGRVQLQLATPSLKQLAAEFPQLHPRLPQVGLDDSLGLLGGASGAAFLEERTALGVKVAGMGHNSLLRHYARRGVPPACRPHVWRRAVNVEFNARERAHFARLLAEAHDRRQLPEALFQLDVKHTASDDSFFVFQDVLSDIVAVFSRDPWVASVSGEPASRSKVHPFRGLVMYAAPLCYLYTKPEQLYFVFRELYHRFWRRLNVLHSSDGSLLFLCKLFEELVQSQEPEVAEHLTRLGVAPLSLAFPWIQFSFAGYLEVAQVLLLWDRIIGFQKLELVPVLAAAIFAFRSADLVDAESVQEVRDILGDPSQLNVVVLLQTFLFVEEGAPGTEGRDIREDDAALL